MANNVRITKTGPLFDEAKRRGLLNKGIANGTRKLLPRVEAAVQAKAPKQSGTFAASVTGRTYPNGMGVVRSRDSRKLKTWLETGRRRGVKTKRKGAYAFRAGKRVAQTENKQGYYAAEIARLLNG